MLILNCNTSAPARFPSWSLGPRNDASEDSAGVLEFRSRGSIGLASAQKQIAGPAQETDGADIGASNSGLARTASNIAMRHQVEVTLTGEERAAGLPQYGAERGRRQPMHQRQHGMELDRKTAIWRGHKQRPARDAPQLLQELRLVRPTANMFEHSARMDVIERIIVERQI